MTKSEIFTQYNKARKAARQGKLDEKRVNRALGIIQSAKPDHGYNTTVKSCNCEDRHQHPSVACKHMVAKMMEVRIAQQQPQPDFLQLAMQYESKKQWPSGEVIYIWGNNKRGAYLKEENGFVRLSIIGHQKSLTVFYLDIDGWQPVANVVSNYQSWIREVNHG